MGHKYSPLKDGRRQNNHRPDIQVLAERWGLGDDSAAILSANRWAEPYLETAKRNNGTVTALFRTPSDPDGTVRLSVSYKKADRKSGKSIPKGQIQLLVTEGGSYEIVTPNLSKDFDSLMEAMRRAAVIVQANALSSQGNPHRQDPKPQGGPKNGSRYG